MRKYFGDTYHGGIMCMHVFGKYAYHQPFFWDWSESIPQWLREYVFRRLDTLPGYKVNLEVDSSSFAYLKSRHPELIDHLKHYIHEGKLEIVDGTFAQPYNVLQSGESCIRHFYYGQKTIHDILGIYVKTYFKQEPLFFPQLPQILKKCSYSNAILRVHISHYGECPQMNVDRILWCAPDGSYVDAVPNYLHVDNPYSMTIALENSPQYEQQCQKTGFESILVTTGLDVAHDADYLPTFKSDYAEKLLPREVEHFTGDWIGHGMSDKRIEQIQQDGYEFTLLSAYFEAEKPSATTVQTRADDFVFRYKFGQFGDLMLRHIRQAEELLYSAEVFASFVKMAQGPLILTEELRKALWEPLLLSQNHDIHAVPTSFSYGVAAAPVNIARTLTDTAKTKAQNIIDESLRYLMANADTKSVRNLSDDAIVLLVFNQLLESRIATVETTVFCLKGFAHTLCLMHNGEKIPFDIAACVRNEDGSIYKITITFSAELPSMGYAAYYLEPASCQAENCSEIGGSGNVIESDALKITFGNNGLLESVFDKDQRFEYLDTRYFLGNELTVDFGNGLLESKKNQCEVRTTCGKVTSTSAVSGMLGTIPYEMFYRLHHKAPRLDCELKIDFDTALHTKSINDQFSKFRVTFNPSFNGQLFVEQPFSVDSSSQEVAAGYHFGSYTDGIRGITLVNSGNIGYFHDVKNNVKFSLILGFGDDSYSYGPLLLSGSHVFRYSLFFHKEDWCTGQCIQKALEISHPPHARQTHVHAGSLRATNSFMNTPAGNIAVSACYPTEDGICLRFWETQKKHTVAPFVFGFKAGNVRESDLLDNCASTIDSSSIRFAPSEIKTLHIEQK